MSRPFLPLATFCAVLVGTLTACATSSPVPKPSRATQILLVVENGHFDPVTVFVLRSGTRVPLGPVRGLSQRRFLIDAASTGPSAMVHLVAENRSAATGPVVAELPVEPGLEVRWVLSLGLKHGMVLIR